MSNEPIDLIRRLPHLYHALEGAVMAGPELHSDYRRELQRLTDEMYDELTEAINACKLSAQATRRAVTALETLRRSATKRARINAAGRVLMEVPREGAGPLSERRGADVEANLNASAECIHIEANATRTLVNLLHDLAA